MEKIINQWNNLDAVLAVLIFVAYFFIDGLYAYYTFSVLKKKPFASATTGLIMHFMLAFGVINYVNNFLYVVPLALGSWLGKYLVVWMEKNNIKFLNRF